MSPRLRRYVVRQFGRPTGWLGRVAGNIMSLRPSNRVRNRRTVELLDIEPEHRVLELGFGPGLAVERAAELATRGQVVGFDHSAEMLRQASRRNAEAIRQGRVELRLGNVEALPRLDSAFDRAMAVNVFMFWKDPPTILARVRGLLRPGGRIAITHQARNRGATSQDSEAGAKKIADALEAAGFQDVHLETIDVEPKAYCVMGTKPSGET